MILSRQLPEVDPAATYNFYPAQSLGSLNQRAPLIIPEPEAFYQIIPAPAPISFSGPHLQIDLPLPGLDIPSSNPLLQGQESPLARLQPVIGSQLSLEQTGQILATINWAGLAQEKAEKIRSSNLVLIKLLNDLGYSEYRSGAGYHKQQLIDKLFEIRRQYDYQQKQLIISHPQYYQ